VLVSDYGGIGGGGKLAVALYQAFALPAIVARWAWCAN